MNTINYKTLAIISRLFKASSKDETRNYLNGVNLRAVNDDKVIIEATTGYYANQTEIIDFDLNQFLKLLFPEGLIISNKNDKMIKEVLKEFKKNYANSPKLFFTLDDFLTLRIGDRILGQLQRIERDYVKLDSVVGNLKESDNIFKIAFNFDCLKKLVESMEKNKHQIISLNLDKSKILEKDTCHMKPILVTSMTQDCKQKAILMPCKV